MSDERLLTILKAPHVSEKGVRTLGDYRQYAFKVLSDATKTEIKKAVERLLKVKVKSVRICNVKKKPARVGRIQGYRKAWKKAYVMLDKGQEIELAGVHQA